MHQPESEFGRGFVYPRALWCALQCSLKIIAADHCSACETIGLLMVGAKKPMEVIPPPQGPHACDAGMGKSSITMLSCDQLLQTNASCLTQ